MIQMVDVNLVAVAVSAVASIVLGMLWYGPLFGKQWMKLTGIKRPEKSDMSMMAKPTIVALIASAVTAYILGAFIKMVGAVGTVEGVTVGAMVWFGFLATSTLSSVLWEGKSINLYALNNGHLLVNLVMYGAILGSM